MQSGFFVLKKISLKSFCHNLSFHVTNRVKEELMEKNQSGFFLQLLEDNKDKIFRICSSFSNEKDEAKDLFQEVTFNIWTSLNSFKGESSSSTWIYRITLNICLRAKSKAQKRQNLFIKLDGLTIEQVADKPPDLEKERLHQQLHDCIKQLEDADRSLILLFLEDLPYKEISAITGITENHVAVKIKRIKNKLFKCIKPC
jgi:RNA polymerase sigma factor (sigma-70 family)